MSPLRVALCLGAAIFAALFLGLFSGSAIGAEFAPAPIEKFFQSHCIDCHRGAEAEGGLDLTELSFDLSTGGAYDRWVRIFDRVDAGEMPPADTESLSTADREPFLTATGAWLREHRQQEDAQLGRVRARRLTRNEIERSLQDLLGIDIPLADQLPEESRSAGFTTVADGQAMSHFQLERHLAVVDVALEEAFRRALSPPDRYERDYDAEGVARRDPNRRTREPEMRNGQAVVWSSGLIYYGRIPATTAPENGWYRFRVRVAGLKLPRSGGVWTTVRSGPCVSSAPLLAFVTAFEATESAKEIEFEAWLPRGHMLEIRPGDVTLRKARFAGGQVGVGEGEPQDVPGIALERLTMEQFHRGADDDQIRRLLFGGLSFRDGGRRNRMAPVSEQPRDDLSELVRQFARRAFRRPVPMDQLAGYVALSQAALDEGESFTEALRVGMRAVLCSPRFLYWTELPGRLDDFAVATRLSYFLTGTMPDAELSQLAAQGRLRDKAVLIEQTDRLLQGPGARRFMSDFAAQWLDLDQIDFTQPDSKLFPDFDAIVQNAMLDETCTYLEQMLRDDVSVTELIDSDYTFLNSRLARYYDIDGVTGDELRRVELSPRHHRGGVLTQGAILKVTANGSNTSPVVRGVWVSERLLGQPIPPPPGNVPAIEPDIRGAKTIREMLAKHRSQDSCASCHRKIDPPGFALENFDPAGQWRDRYIQLVDGRRSTGKEVDASYDLPDGKKFADVDEFRKLVVAEPRQLAASVAEKMLVYGTGAPLSFADRQVVEQILDQAAEGNYGLRSILYSVVTSPVFLSK